MRKIIPRDLIKHLEWNPDKQSTPSPVAAQPQVQPKNLTFPNLPTENFIMAYDGHHGEYFQELISKVNEVYAGTKAEIPIGTEGEVQGNSIKRMGLISTIANDPNLRSGGLWPITATQSEYLLQAGKLPNPGDYWEDFGVVLFDRSSEGRNPKEAQTIYESLLEHRQDLGLSVEDLEKKLVVVNPGAEVNPSMPHGIKPIIVPGITQVYQHEILEKAGEDPNFEGYGLTGGLPQFNQLNKGDRTMFLPDETEDIGLRVLYRDRDLNLVAWNDVLAYSDSYGRVTFARSASP